MRFAASLTDISLFVAVYEERSITTAAEREHATQSGVSQHIRKLEQGLGVVLFLRDSGGMQPTPAGETYYRACVELLRQYEAAARDVQQYKGRLEGEVSIGLMATITRSALAPALTKFTEEHPNVRVRVIEAPSRLLAQQVHAGEMDFAVVPTLLEHAGVRRSFFLRTPEVLVSRPGTGVVHLKAAELGAIEQLKLILPSPRNIRRQTFERYFQQAGVRPTRELELDVIFTALDMVEKTDWRTILPAIMMVEEIQNRQLTINTLAKPGLWLDFSCIEPLRRSLSPAASAFLEFLKIESDRLNVIALKRLQPGAK
ncbi:LysR family transcriptional regulator [Variovorax guangxiensis]|uniref:LysR family transcriptional regulator n=1 Tax=Variovorax guangxiensis TaxID=1775474 RepID=UPI002858F175|nr:LysR family transcriptional regulator [Variovorax guangxiensis]MDR6858706.1 DNA-binding transcriptional LysR family regulator [Variovorax guangxiensis]